MTVKVYKTCDFCVCGFISFCVKGPWPKRQMSINQLTGLYTYSSPVRTPGFLVENTSSVSPACRKRRLKGRRYIAIVADTVRLG